MFQDLVASAGWLQSRPDCTDRLGAVGFCWGGSMVHLLATRLPELNAAVPFYGIAPAPSEAAMVKAPLLVHLAGVDERVNSAWPPYETALKAAGVKYTMYQYAGTQHGFNNDTTPRYDAAAAKLAWERTVAFFKANLSAT
jgi:carboxymethylenebutenolidase